MLKKIFISLTIILLITSLLTLLNIGKEKTLRTNFEIEKMTNIKNTTVYLLDSNNYFVEVDIFISNGTLKDTISRIIDYLKVTNDNIETNFNGYIPNNAKVNGLEVINETAYLDFSKELVEKDTLPLKGIIKTLLRQKGINKVSIKIDGEYINGFEGEIEDISLNEENSFYSRKDITKVVVYYSEKEAGREYFVPVTKYLNNDNEKIDIIVEELKTNIPSNLIGYPNLKVELIDSTEEGDSLILTFNEYIKDDKKSLNQIAKSVFENYDVSSVIFKVGNKIEKIITKNDKIN